MNVFPRVPFAHAERHVDWSAHEREILNARFRVEQRILSRLRRAATLIDAHKAAPLAVQHDLAQQAKRALAQTARFGYQNAQREIAQQRGSATTTPTPSEPDDGDAVGDALLLALLARLALSGPDVSSRSLLARLRRRAAEDHGGRLARYAVGGVGGHAHVALEGWSGVLRLLSDRADAMARDIISAMLGRHARLQPQAEGASVLADLLAEGGRVAHNETLELVGEALNLGRAAGASALAKPPRFAMRSEQLDRNTCSPCDALHGQTAVVDSPEYFALMPPQGCLGGGRCRGIIVFADDLVSLQVGLVASRRG